MRIFVVLGGDASELLEFVEEALDKVSLSIDPTAEGEAVLSVALGRNIGPGFLLVCGGAQRIGVIGLVGQHDCALPHCAKHGQGHLAVMLLPGGQIKRDRAVLGIDDRMDFGGQPATGTSHAAIVKAPFFRWRRADARGHRRSRS